MLDEGLAGREVGQRSEGGEGVADAQDEVTVAEAPEVLGVVVQVPGGAGEDFASRKFQENSVDDTVLVVFGLVAQARDEAVDDEGEQKVFVINVVQREHRAAVEQELRREGLEAEVFEWDAKGRLRAASKRGDGYEENKPAQPGMKAALRGRDGEVGNRHGTGRVSLHY